MGAGERMEKGNILSPKFPTPYFCPSEGILQAADY